MIQKMLIFIFQDFFTSPLSKMSSPERSKDVQALLENHKSPNLNTGTIEKARQSIVKLMPHNANTITEQLDLEIGTQFKFVFREWDKQNSKFNITDEYKIFILMWMCRRDINVWRPKGPTYTAKLEELGLTQAALDACVKKKLSEDNFERYGVDPAIYRRAMEHFLFMCVKRTNDLVDNARFAVEKKGGISNPTEKKLAISYEMKPWVCPNNVTASGILTDEEKDGLTGYSFTKLDALLHTNIARYEAAQQRDLFVNMLESMASCTPCPPDRLRQALQKEQEKTERQGGTWNLRVKSTTSRQIEENWQSQERERLEANMAYTLPEMLAALVQVGYEQGRLEDMFKKLDAFACQQGILIPFNQCHASLTRAGFLSHNLIATTASGMFSVPTSIRSAQFY
jgi:hypothetical protein